MKSIQLSTGLAIAKGGESLLSSEDVSTHFLQMVPFYTSQKHQKIFGFLEFSGGIK